MTIVKMDNHRDAAAHSPKICALSRQNDPAEEELMDLVRTAPAAHRISDKLLSKGYARPVRAYVDRHGPVGMNSAAVDVFELLTAASGAADALVLVDLLKGITRLEPRQQVVAMMRIFGHIDDPEAFTEALDILDLGHNLLPRAFCHVGPWGESVPRMARWTAGVIERDYDAKNTDWRILTDDAIFRPYPHILGALLKMGVNITPNLISSQVGNGEFAWIPRVIARTESAHARLRMANDLPEIADLLAMRFHEVVALIAGPKPDPAK